MVLAIKMDPNSHIQRLRKEYPATWIARRSGEPLANPQLDAPNRDSSAPGLAAKYPGDVGIENDPDVLFADNFSTWSRTGRWTNTGEIASFHRDWTKGRMPGRTLSFR